MRERSSVTAPLRPGYCSSMAKLSSPSASSALHSLTVMPKGRARVWITSSVCGSTSRSTRNVVDFDLPTRSASVMASAAAVASSSIEALAIGKAVKSQIMV